LVDGQFFLNFGRDLIWQIVIFFNFDEINTCQNIIIQIDCYIMSTLSISEVLAKSSLISH